MKFTETALAGAYIIDIEPRHDDRGFFTRTFCQKEFAAHGLKTTVAQGNMSFNKAAGTLRGMHFQYPPVAETKFISCPHGALYDVIVDLRPESPTYLHHVGVELSQDNHRALYVPERFGHGFMTLSDDTVATYLVGEFYTPGEEGGLRHDDPSLGIEWPRAAAVISEKDAAWPSLEESRARIESGMAIG